MTGPVLLYCHSFNQLIIETTNPQPASSNHGITITIGRESDVDLLAVFRNLRECKKYQIAGSSVNVNVCSRKHVPTEISPC
ncbi:hypothetical protein NSMM_150073 [Nitrosomonas mobilis]|uniref:Uncharacterized protein n=1 Tax=Nitrosomonas mobilis TaxID=51642 RepID=A0A1G5SAW0_9PROT|nr:hypothetical protein NSMM_150073 [Nitrosomonas mobilis]